MPPKSKYTLLSQRQQILKRPAQHMGSVKNAIHKVWLAETQIDDDGEQVERIVSQEINYNPALLHIFYELLSNAVDNYFRSTATPQKVIKVTVDQENGQVMVWNDGDWIATIYHEWKPGEDVLKDKDYYEAEIIFGHLNSSSNYNDDEEGEERKGGGLHGHGAKLTNIMSSHFKVTTFDPDTGLKFEQAYTENMGKPGKPKITALKQTKGYTQITYTADFKRFSLKSYSDEHLQVMRKMCIDAAMCTGKPVHFNGDVIRVKSLAEYVNYYIGGSDGECKMMEFKTKDSSVLLCEKPAFELGLVQVSFVNGIPTKRGVHIEAWRKAIFQELLSKIQAKYAKDKNSAKLKLTAKNLESYFMFFINCNLYNPEFPSQHKEELTGPVPETKVSAAKIKELLTWGFMDDIDEMVTAQNLKDLKKTDGKHTANVSGIPNFDDANKAGTAKSLDCTLLIIEGLSAKTFAVKGVGTIENGTDWFGIFPARGKLLNVRDASSQQINANVEISNLKKILGLQHGADYSDDKVFKTLRYGKVRILTDPDPDGDHIKGLVINYFQKFHPDLIDRDYIASLRTPIVKVKMGKKIIAFYYLKNYKAWREKQTKSYTAKYYKGLGTSEDAEIREIFAAPRNMQFVEDPHAKETTELVFSKNRANDRKKWLEGYEEQEFEYETNEDGEEQVPISTFLNYELIEFSIYDNKRSIPSVVDGFKPSQRKAMWVGLKMLNTKKEIKVAQFAGKVAEKSEYHHGESSMEGAIIKMAQTFVGSNNIALFYESGQFGTRLEGGDDAASGRYIFTKLATIARYVLRKEDDPILEYLEDDGKMIEPKFFVPVIPLLLANGSDGIGSGWSSKIPNFNPLDLVEWIRVWLGDDEEPDYPELVPWYWGFKGTFERDDKLAHRFLHYGKVEAIGKDCYQITELPVGMWTNKYKLILDGLKSGNKPASAKKVKTGYDAKTVATLREELKARSLPHTGTKKTVIQRLKANDKEQGTKVKTTTTGVVNKYEWYGDAYNVNFKVWVKPGVVIDHDNDDFKLKDSKLLSNMSAFMPTGGIKRYTDLEEILDTFCQVRFEYYVKRKEHLIGVLENELQALESKVRFIGEVLNSDFKLLKQTEAKLIEYLQDNGYWATPSKKSVGDADANDDEATPDPSNDEDRGPKHPYRYLTNMRVRLFATDNKSKLLQNIKDKKKEIAYVKKTAPKDMWLKELDEFVVEYKKWKSTMEKQHADLAKKKIKYAGKKGKGKSKK